MKKQVNIILLLLILLICTLALCACDTEKHEHVFGEWTITKEATCTETGLKERTCECGEKETEIIPATGHIWGNETILHAATCQAAGTKQYTCSICRQTKTETIAKLAHSFDAGIVTVDPTCSVAGSKLYTCSECGYTKTESVAKLPHSFDEGQITHEPNCTQTGTKLYTCTVCGETKTEIIEALGHDPDENYICRRCGEACPVEINMTNAEQQSASAVKYLSQKSIDHDDTNSRFVFHFALLDSHYDEVKAPAAVELRIVNDDDLVVYSAVKIVLTNDFSTWTKNDTRHLLATIYINDDEITQGLSDDGDIYFRVYNNDYFSFEESSLTIWSDLPQLPVTIELPELPQTINYYNYSGVLTSSCTVTDITYGFNEYGSSFYIYFTGEKTYDKDGENNNSYCYIGYKLYDAEGYVIKTGTVFTNQMTVGEKFKNEKLYFADAERGQTYRLELLNVT